MLGLRRSSRTSPLLQSLNIKSAFNVIHVQGANLLRSVLFYHSSATVFYTHLLQCDSSVQKNTLVERCLTFFKNRGASLFSYVLSSSYKNAFLKKLYLPTWSDGVLDTINYLYSNYDAYARTLLQGIVSVSF